MDYIQGCTIRGAKTGSSLGLEDILDTQLLLASTNIIEI